MFSTLIQWAEIAITAFASLFDLLSKSFTDIVSETDWDWLFHIIDKVTGWFNNWISNIPIFGQWGASLWKWVTNTPIIEMIIASLPIALLLSAITWVINIVF